MRKVLIPVLCLLMPLILGSCTNWEAEETDALEKMSDAVRASGKYESKREELRALLKTEPENRGALLQLAYLEWGFDRFDEQSLDESDEHLESALKSWPGLEVAVRLQGHNDEWRKKMTNLEGMRIDGIDTGIYNKDGEIVEYSGGGLKFKPVESSLENTGPGRVFVGKGGEEYILAAGPGGDKVQFTPVKEIGDSRAALIEPGKP